VEVRQIAGRVRLARVPLITDVTGLGRPGDAGLLAVVLRSVQTARVGRLDRQVECGIDKRWEASLRATVAVVARTLTAVAAAGRRRRVLSLD